MSSLDDMIAEAFGEEVPVEPAPEPSEQVVTEASAEEVDGTSEQEAVPTEQPRDEQGRFAATAEEKDEGLDKYLERFGGDVDKALKAAVEADRMIGRQGQQMGELQKQLTELQEALQAPMPEQPAPVTQEMVDWFDEQAMEDPAGAVAYALQNDPTGVLYNRAMDVWYEESPRQAAAFERRLELQAYQQEMWQQQRPLYEQAARQDFAALWQEMAADIPELRDPATAEAMMQAVREAPEILAGLRSGLPDDRKRMIRNLYKLAKFEQANRVASEAQYAPSNESPQAPHVASQETNVDPEPKSAGERWAEEFLDPEFERYTKAAFEL